jgi:hypothetical protein
MRYATDRRHTFWQETAGLLGLMLVRAYGCTELLTNEMPIGEDRTNLPPFQPELCAKWARGEIRWDPNEYHRRMIQPKRGPDPTKHQIISEHCAVLINSHVPRFKLNLTADQLKAMFPGFVVRSKPTGNNAGPNRALVERSTAAKKQAADRPIDAFF